MNKNTAYLVLSVRNIKNLLAAAIASAEASGDDETHCIILRNIRLNPEPDGDEMQIASYDITERAIAVWETANAVLNLTTTTL